MMVITRSMKILSNGIQIYLGLTIYLYTSVSSRCNDSRINQGGSEASITEAPWTVALVRFYFPFCTGSIIEANWILTAAHCIIKIRAEPSKLKVVAGADDLDTLLSNKTPIVQKRTARRIHYHPDYRPAETGATDIALIYVDELYFSKRVKPVNLWDMEWPGPASLVTCEAFGWGLIANKYDDEEQVMAADSLRKTDVKAQHGRCSCLRKRNAQRRMLCSHPSSTGGICQGDSGGPLICNNKLAGVAYAVLNKDCRQYTGKPQIPCNSPDTESLWVYVCPMLRFIRHHVPSAPVHPESCKSPRFSANFGIIFWFPTFICLLNSLMQSI